MKIDVIAFEMRQFCRHKYMGRYMGQDKKIVYSANMPISALHGSCEEQTPSAASIVQEYAAAGLHLREFFFATQTHLLVDAARHMALALARGKKILLCGNGGSAANAQHIACEFTNRFLMDRPGLPAIALTSNTSTLTAIGNDFGFENIFVKQIQAIGQNGDVLIAISTSGSSENILKAVVEAKKLGLKTIGLTQESDTTAHTENITNLCDTVFAVPQNITPLIHEVHMSIGNMLCRLVDYFLFENIVELGLTD